jgi:pimeloyl-ACP methyl ester carboxylesterase
VPRLRHPRALSQFVDACRGRVEYRGDPLRRHLAAALAFVAIAVVAPSAVAAPTLKACSGQEEFGCATLDVPLDRTGAIPGTVPLHYAVQRHGPRPILIALSGGPGQAGVAAASSFALSLEPTLRRYRIAVLDQRGTGQSGVLSCPNLQRLRSLDALLPASVAACAGRIGPRRVDYSSADTVLDIDDLRKALGVDKIALAGISYGTHVALQYARAFPEHVDRLILDSIVGPDGPDAFMMDTWRNLPRVLREQCANGACKLATRDPVSDVAALVNRINARGPLRGTTFDELGRPQATAYGTPDELAFLLVAGDLNPYLQASLPAALSAARLGDSSLLMRLRRIGQGAPLATDELSFGLYAAAGCADMTTPYSLATPLADRGAAVQQALAAVPPSQYAPFDAATVIRTGNVDDCSQWPVGTARPPFTGPLPDVPALLLGGRLDTRTPIENAFATKAQLPRASVVTLKGSGHDTMDSDITGCIARAMQRFIGDRAVGHPCVGQDNGVPPTPLPPRGLSDFRSAPGVGGDRGRALFAVLDTAADARLSVLQALYAGLEVRGGGLHGGYYTAGSAIEGHIRLHHYAYVPGLRVTGAVRVTEGELTGTLQVSGRAHGVLKLDHRGGATGVLGGRHVRFRPKHRASASALRVDGASVLRSIQGPVRRRALR